MGRHCQAHFTPQFQKNSLYPLPHILPRWCEITHPRFSFPNGRLRRMKGLKTLQTIPKKIFFKVFTSLLSVLPVSNNFCGYNAHLSCAIAGTAEKASTPNDCYAFIQLLYYQVNIIIHLLILQIFHYMYLTLFHSIFPHHTWCNNHSGDNMMLCFSLHYL